MTRPSQETIDARVTIGYLLTLVAQKVSKEMDKFSGWLLAGFGAAFALMLGNLNTVLTYVGFEAFRQGLGWFLGALVVGLIEKYIAARIAGSSGAAIAGHKHSKELSERGVQLNVELFLEEMSASSPWFVRWAMRRRFNKLRQGDYAITGRLLVHTAFAQTLLVLCQTGLLVVSAINIVKNFYH